jgi:hypothetical protein
MAVDIRALSLRNQIVGVEVMSFPFLTSSSSKTTSRLRETVHGDVRRVCRSGCRVPRARRDPCVLRRSGCPIASAATTPAQKIGMRVLMITDSTDTATASVIAYATG